MLTSANSWAKNDHNFLNRQHCIELTLARENAIYLFWYLSVWFLHKALRFSARNYLSCIYPPPQILQIPKNVLHFQQLIQACTQLKYFIHKPQCITFWRILNSLLEEFRDHELQERHRKLLPLTSHLWWTMRKHEVCFHIATHDHVSNVQNVSKPVQLQMESKVFKSLPNEKVPELTYDSCSLHSPYLQSWQSTCITEEPEGKEKVTSFECVDVKLRILIG